MFKHTVYSTFIEDNRWPECIRFRDRALPPVPMFMDDLSAQPMRLSLQLVLVFIIGSGFEPIQGVTKI